MGRSDATLLKKKQGEASGGRDGGSVPSPEVDKKCSTTTVYRTGQNTTIFPCSSINARAECDAEHSRPYRDSRPPLSD